MTNIFTIFKYVFQEVKFAFITLKEAKQISINLKLMQISLDLENYFHKVTSYFQNVFHIKNAQFSSLTAYVNLLTAAYG